MSTAVEAHRRSWHGAEMSVEEFLAIPEDGIHRELIMGKVREERDFIPLEERGRPVTVRNRFHSRIVIRIGQLLADWMDGQPEPRGEVVCGEAGFWLLGTKDSLVGIDVAVVSPELVAATGPEEKLFHGCSRARGGDPVSERHSRRHRRDDQILSRGRNRRVGCRSRLRDCRRTPKGPRRKGSVRAPGSRRNPVTGDTHEGIVEMVRSYLGSAPSCGGRS